MSSIAAVAAAATVMHRLQANRFAVLSVWKCFALRGMSRSE
jgi:hypothetical protein